MSKKTPKKHKSQYSNGSPQQSPNPVTSHGSLDREDQNVSDTNSVLSSHFSPVAVTSPSTVYRGGQLTGLPRKVKDTCADWHNYILDWEALNMKGMQIISEIANIKIKAGAETVNEEGEAQGDLSAVLPEGLEQLCQSMKQIYLSMEKLVAKFVTMTSSLKGVTALDQSRQDKSFMDSSSELLFQTWPTHLFHETSEKLLAMYQKELDLKQNIMQNVAHCNDRDTLLTYTAVWLHQPYLDVESETLLEGMLLETGLR